MNNVSVKHKLIFYFVTGLLAIPFVFIMVLIQADNIIRFSISIMPVWLFWWWGSLIIHLNNADISVNETNDIVTVKTIFRKKIIPLNELEIERHNAMINSKLGFIFYTNFNRIILNYTKNNYNIMLNVLRLKKYKNIEQFIADVEKMASIIDLN
jgi:hypothetical protein